MKTLALVGLVFALILRAQAPEATLAILSGAVLADAGTSLAGIAQFTAGNEFIRVEAEKTATRPVKVISRGDVDRALANVQ